MMVINKCIRPNAGADLSALGGYSSIPSIV